VTTNEQPLRYPFGEPDGLDMDPRYAELRKGAALTRVRLPYGEDAWLATRHADVKLVLGDPRFSRAMAVGRDEPRTGPQPSGGGMLAMDPPDHTVLRKLVTRAFTMRRVEQLRSRAQEVADALIDEMTAAGDRADLVDRFAMRFSVTMICELLGVPIAERERFRHWSDAFLSTTSLPPEQMQERMGAMLAYMKGLLELRRREPADDLLSAIVQAQDDRTVLTENELVWLGVGLLVAGFETTATELCNSVYLLLTRPDKLAQLRAEPDLIPRAVEELLRYIPLQVAGAFARYATEDVEVGGVLVAKGEPVVAARL
jgi:cytochrome P450